MNGKPLTVAIVAGEASGDRLGGALMAELREMSGDGIRFVGVGGDDMVGQGLVPLFPMAEIAVMGVFTILRRLPSLRRRILETVAAVVETRPDILVLVDCPEFSHRVARRVRARLPRLPVVDYVAPTVWAWRPGRARAMRPYVDEVLALLPFEPDVFARLGGPGCRYVGHPAVERAAPDPDATAGLRAQLGGAGPVLAVLPGSRINEIVRLCAPFGEAAAVLSASMPGLGVVLPALPHTRPWIDKAVSKWPIRPVVVTGEAERHAAMTMADAALVASGTATLELALAGTPMVVGYRMEGIYSFLRRYLPVHSIVLANLIHGDNPVPELFQGACTGPKLANAVAPLLESGTPERDAQLVALARIGEKLRATGTRPSRAAAEAVLQALTRSRAQSLAPPSG